MTTAQRWTLTAAVLGSGIVFLDSTLVNVALPQIGRQLPVHLFGVLEGQTYVYTGYLLSLSALLILAGALNDYYGRRRMFAIGLAGFGVTSILCGLAPNLELLVVLRLLQGAAGALLVPGSLSLLTAGFSGEAQGRAFGIWAGASSATTLLGPFVGGVLVDTVSWRAAFLINGPLVVLALYALLAHTTESRDEDAYPRFDWIGAGVVAVAVGGLSFGAIYGQQREWRDPIAYAALAVGVLATGALPVLMRLAPHPLIPPGLFRSRNFTVVNISTLLIYGALYTVGYNQALFLQGTLGYNAAAAGLAGIPAGLLLTLLSARVGRLAGRYGPRPFMVVGPVVMAVGVALFALAPAVEVPWLVSGNRPGTLVPPGDFLRYFLPGGVIFGVGLSIMVAPLTAALMTSVPVRNSGVASAINNAISRIGPQLAGAGIFVAVTATFYRALGSRLGVDPGAGSLRAAASPLNHALPGSSEAVVRAATLASGDAFHVAMLIGSGLLLVGALVNLGIRRPPPATASTTAAPVEAAERI
ncbi:MAG: MFS transporter [Candidatus Dormibacteraeota bacterium]|nr:MFS transporter [Candidatus Dormibacteraeota bacterium]